MVIIKNVLYLMNMKKCKFTIILFVLIWNLYSCASQGPPGGGPKDTVPPDIVL